MNTQDNVQMVQQIYAAFGRGDIPAILNTMADGVEWHDVEWRLGPGDTLPWTLRRGRDGVAQFFQDLGGALEVLGFEPKEFIAQGEKVVALGSVQARVKSTGRTFDDNWAMVWTFGGDKVVGFRIYHDTGAIAAAFRG